MPPAQTLLVSQPFPYAPALRAANHFSLSCVTAGHAAVASSFGAHSSYFNDALIAMMRVM
jgi:hypothetical protein